MQQYLHHKLQTIGHLNLYVLLQTLWVCCGVNAIFGLSSVWKLRRAHPITRLIHEKLSIKPAGLSRQCRDDIGLVTATKWGPFTYSGLHTMSVMPVWGSIHTTWQGKPAEIWLHKNCTVKKKQQWKQRNQWTTWCKKSKQWRITFFLFTATCTFRTALYVLCLHSFWLAVLAWFIAGATAAWCHVWVFGAPFGNKEIKTSSAWAEQLHCIH